MPRNYCSKKLVDVCAYALGKKIVEINLFGTVSKLNFCMDFVYKVCCSNFCWQVWFKNQVT